MPYPIADPKVIERARQVLALDPLFLNGNDRNRSE